MFWFCILAEDRKEGDEGSFLSIFMSFYEMACSSTVPCLVAIIPHSASDHHWIHYQSLPDITQLVWILKISVCWITRLRYYDLCTVMGVRMNLATQEIHFIYLIVKIWTSNGQSKQEQDEVYCQISDMKPCQWYVSELHVNPFLPETGSPFYSVILSSHQPPMIQTQAWPVIKILLHSNYVRS